MDDQTLSAGLIEAPRTPLFDAESFPGAEAITFVGQHRYTAAQPLPEQLPRILESVATPQPHPPLRRWAVPGLSSVGDLPG